jgi:kelch-like protein 10
VEQVNDSIIWRFGITTTMKALKSSRSALTHVLPSSNKATQHKEISTLNLTKCVCNIDNSGLVAFPKAWNEFRTNQQLCDSILHSGDGKTFYIHRIILSAVSSYFEDLFTNSQNGGEPEMNEMYLDVPGHILNLILDYAYTGHCNVTSENIQQLLPIADQYEIFGVLHQSFQYLFEELKPDNCIGIFKFARPYFCSHLKDRGLKYICHNFKQILEQSPEFKDFSVEELECILCHDELNVHREEVVFEAVMKWTEADLQVREQYLRTLIHCVRYGLTSINFLRHVMNNKLILASPELQSSLYPAYVYLAELDSGQSCNRAVNNPTARPRIPYEIIFVVGGWNGEGNTRFIETYDIRADKWFICMKTDDVAARETHGLCALDNLIYVVGGYVGREYLNTVCCYNPITQKQKYCASMHHARSGVGVCTQDGKIYAIGGYNGKIEMNSAERYSPNLNLWEMIPPMHCVRSEASAASLNGKIYIAGGTNEHQALRSAEVFDPDTNEWTFIPPMANARSGLSLVVYNNCLYALGGYNEHTIFRSGERYNPSYSSDWQQISEMHNPRNNCAAVVLEDMIFVVGGAKFLQPIASVEYYDADFDQWHEASSMNMKRDGLSACVLAGLPNAKEYSHASRIQEKDQQISNDNSTY